MIGRKVSFNLFCKQEWTQQLQCLKHTFQPPAMFDCKYSISNLAFSFAKSVCSPENVFISAKWGSAVFIKHFVGRWWRSNKKMLIQYFFSLSESEIFIEKFLMEWRAIQNCCISSSKRNTICSQEVKQTSVLPTELFWNVLCISFDLTWFDIVESKGIWPNNILWSTW